MALSHSCSCSLCGVERQLIENLTRLKSSVSSEMTLLGFDSPLTLIEFLRNSTTGARSDEILQALFHLRSEASEFVDSFLILAFLPVLHQTVRRVALYQPLLFEEDISQQILACFLQVLASNELRHTKSHYAFALARSMKRRILKWGQLEGWDSKRFLNGDDKTHGLAIADHFERHAELRHFLNRCVERGDLNTSEIDLLVRFRLEGTYSKHLLSLNGNSSNAVRQRMKRLLAKLRRLAVRKEPDEPASPPPPLSPRQ